MKLCVLLFRNRHNLQFIRHTRDRRKPVFFYSNVKAASGVLCEVLEDKACATSVGLGQAKDETVDTVKNSEKEGNAFVYKNCSYKVQQVWEGVRPCADMNAQ